VHGDGGDPPEPGRQVAVPAGRAAADGAGPVGDPAKRVGSRAPGGLLLYCTCSPLKEENEEVVRAFLAERPEAVVAAAPDGWPGPPDAWTGDGFLRLYPHRHGTDAFYAALLWKG